MYVRQEAYYNTTPDGSKFTRAEQIERWNNGIKDIEKKSDDDSVELAGPDVSLRELQEIPMPEIPEGSEYLVALLHSAGTASATGMGLVGLSWQEINAWLDCSDMKGIATPRDLDIVHTLSRAYASEMAEAGKKGATPPYTPMLEVEEMEEHREVISQNLDDIFAGMIASQNSEEVF